MRLLHWYPSFLAGGAIAETVLGLANAQVQDGHDVLVACRRPGDRSTYNPRIQQDLQGELHIWEASFAVNLGRLPVSIIPRACVRFLRRYQADILHIHNGIFVEDALIRLARVSRRSVLTPHGAFYPEALSAKMRLYMKALRPFLYDRVSSFHAVSPHETETIRNLFPSTPVYEAPNALSAAFERAWDGGDKGSQDRILLVCVGRLDVRHKGLDILLPGFARAVREVSRDLHLLLVGPEWGDDQLRIQRLIAEQNLENHVTLTGPRDREGVVEILRGGDIFVQTSRWDAFSLAAIEAMALGLPTILSTRVGAASYPLVATASSVNLTEPDVTAVSMTIQRVVRSITQQRESAQEFAPRVRQFFSWQRVAQTHDHEYGRLTGEGNYPYPESP